MCKEETARDKKRWNLHVRSGLEDDDDVARGASFASVQFSQIVVAMAGSNDSLGEQDSISICTILRTTSRKRMILCLLESSRQAWQENNLCRDHARFGIYALSECKDSDGSSQTLQQHFDRSHGGLMQYFDRFHSCLNQHFDLFHGCLKAEF
jgi:hypothetical protein